MTFASLVNEYRAAHIGEEIYALVRSLCQSLAQRYPSSVYNNGLEWDSQGFDDLCQEVVLEQLINRGQIGYIFDVADDEESVRRLFVHQIKRTLAERRVIGPIERLLQRARELSEEGNFGYFGSGPTAYFAMRTGTKAHVALLQAQLAVAARAAQHIPRLASRISASRESAIYPKGALIEVMEAVLGSVGVIAEYELRTVFEILLTPWTPAMLVPVEDEYVAALVAADQNIDGNRTIHEVQAFASRLTTQELTVLVLKSQNISDAHVANAINVSRPTVASMKTAVLDRVGTELLGDIDPEFHTIAIEQLLDTAANLLAVRS